MKYFNLQICGQALKTTQLQLLKMFRYAYFYQLLCHYQLGNKQQLKFYDIEM